MKDGTWAACFVALAATGLPAVPATACEAIKIGRGVDVQEAVWRSAVAELARASASEGQPWSCSGGTVDLSVHEGGATLTVIDSAGRVISREVATPEDVVPLGEALLSKPLAGPDKPVIRPIQPSGKGATEPDHAASPRLAGNPTPPKQPYAVLDAAIAPRYAGRADIVWGGVTASAQVPFSGGASGGWLAGGWVRYDGPAASLGDRELHMTEICIGSSVAKSFLISPLELRIGARPSIAIVTQSFGREHDDATRVDARMGLDATLVVPVASPVRGWLGLDGEFSPREMGEDDHRPAPPRGGDLFATRFPTYTFGLGLGVEVAIR